MTAACAVHISRGMTAAISISMELVNPPEGSGSVYVARFADGSPVATSTGFSNLGFESLLVHGEDAGAAGSGVLRTRRASECGRSYRLGFSSASSFGGFTLRRR
jgi:hypothetical protein